MSFPWTIRSTAFWTAVAVLLSTPFSLRAQNDRRSLHLPETAFVHVPVVPEAGGWTIQSEIDNGARYLAGRGVPQDPALAAYWYGKAAAQGDPDAENELGYFYTVGIGVSADPQRAVMWYERAMAGGSKMAKLNLAVMFLKGSGVEPDPKFAVTLLEQLGRAHFRWAEAYLGFAYALGEGVPMDSHMADKWLTQAAKHHSPEGEYGLAVLYSTADNHPHNFPRAAKLLRSSAKAGYVPAIYGLGQLLLDHPELRRSPDEAIKMLQAAADVGSWRASARLGYMARDGIDRPVDMADAYRWFTIATRQGGQNAAKLLDGSREQCAASLTAVSHERENQEVDIWFRYHRHADLFVHPAQFAKGLFPAEEIPVTPSNTKGHEDPGAD